jgi:methylase of polypeptide subunit release factors
MASTAGVVYTKDWVVDFVLDTAGYTADKDLANLVVIEPSCGCGAFLCRLAERLCASAKHHHGTIGSNLLKNSLRAYDTDTSAVAVSKRRVTDTLKEQGLDSGQAASLANACIKQGDFLLAQDVPSADFVVGNPPYIRSSDMPRAVREAYATSCSCMSLGTDLYIGFFEKGLRLLNNKGVLCFICADRWLQNKYGAKLRSLVADEYSFDALIRMHDVDAFEDQVSSYPAVTRISRTTQSPTFAYVECLSGFAANDTSEIIGWMSSNEVSRSTAAYKAAMLATPRDGSVMPLSSPDKVALISSLCQQFPALEESDVQLGIGVASGCDDVYIVGDSCDVEEDRLLPLFYMRDWRAGKQGLCKWLVNPWDQNGTLVDLNSYPRLQAYFQSNEERLRKRHVARTHPDTWYRTLDKPNRRLFGREMLLFPDMAAHATPVYSDGSRYPHHNCYWMTSDTWDLNVLGGLLMSDIAENFVDALGVKMRGQTMRFQAQYLRLIHVPQYRDISPAVRKDLARAFVEKDHDLSCSAARQAYGITEGSPEWN